MVRLYSTGTTDPALLTEYARHHRHAPGSTAWTPRTALTRAATVLRTEGVRPLALKCLGETCYRRLYLLECHLERLPAPPAPTIPATVGRLDSPPDYREFRADAPEDEVPRLLEAGGCCYVARHEGRIVSATWAFPGRTPVPYLGAVLDGGPGAMVLYDSWTSPALRGHGLSPAIGHAIATEARARGFVRVLTAVLPENGSSLAARRKLGFRVIGLLVCVRIGRLRLHLPRRRSGGWPR